jgi:CBS domain-containing protein
VAGAALGRFRGCEAALAAGSTETEHTMAGAAAQQPSSRSHAPATATATAADVMRPALTTVEASAHLAAAAYLMSHAGETALVVIDEEQARRPIGLVTDADISLAVADGKDVNVVRIRDLMTAEPIVVAPSTTIREVARSMVTGQLRHLPVVSDVGLVGIIDIGDVCRVLLDPGGESPLPADTVS